MYFQPRKRAASQDRGKFSDDSPSSEGESGDEGSALRRSGKKDRAAGAPRAQSRRKEATKGSAGAASKSADSRSKRKEPGADDGLINDDSSSSEGAYLSAII